MFVWCSNDQLRHNIDFLDHFFEHQLWISALVKKLLEPAIREHDSDFDFDWLSKNQVSSNVIIIHFAMKLAHCAAAVNSRSILNEISSQITSQVPQKRFCVFLVILRTKIQLFHFNVRRLEAIGTYIMRMFMYSEKNIIVQVFFLHLSLKYFESVSTCTRYN